MAAGRSPKQKPDKKQEKIEALRERLYARDNETRKEERTKLHRIEEAEVDVLRDWESRPRQRPQQGMKQEIGRPGSRPVARAPQPQQPFNPYKQQDDMPATKKRSHGYRMKFVLGGLVFFTIMLVISGAFLIWGNNSISGENISIDVTGPFAVSGGDELPLRIAISNQNSVPIESATLIIEYPPGTQSADQEGKELFSERQQLDVIQAGEVHNIDAKARVFGEENAEKTVKVSMEYRVHGSNATFYKEAAPFRFKISSSPVVLDVNAIKSLSSGQETEVTLKVTSNSPSSLNNVLVKADYPSGFDFSFADPGPAAGNNTWLIDELKPEETKTITLKGVLSGQQDEDKIFNFSVGVPNERDQYALSSIFTTGTADVKIEAPFLGVDVSVNNDTSDVVAIDKSQSANVKVTFTNTLEDTIYDGGIEIKLGGNALNDVNVDVKDGFYNSSTHTVSFDSVGVTALKEITPGTANSVSFTLSPKDSSQQTPEVTMDVTVRGKRVFEDRVPQELVATASRTIRMTSVASLSSLVHYDSGPFTNTGPTPPVAGKLTTYTVDMTAKGGSNDLTGTQVTAVLPQYVTWLGNVSFGDSISYNSSTRTVTWDIGSMSSGKTESASMQIGVTPSTSQIDTIPTVMETQHLRATDRFTSAIVRTDAPALTTAVGANTDSGRVRTSE